MKLDGKKVINNIYYLAKVNKVKIGDLENAAEVSAGYLSKLLKEDVDTIPGTEILFNISNMLNVSLDNLLRIDYNSVDPTEKYLSDFLDKVIEKTLNGRIDWKYESPTLVSQSTHQHPLYRYDYDDSCYQPSLVYDSKFWYYKEDCDATPVDNFFSFKNNETTYYIVQVDISIKEKTFRGYEFYAYTNNETKKICCSSERNDLIHSHLKNLYAVVKDYLSKPKIDEDIKNAIDSFLNE